MPSYLHELLLLLFRNRARSAADLLRQLDVQLPEYDDVHTESSDLLEEAEENVELAVLSAMEHGQSPDIELAARVASVAILASAGIDAERSRLYLDLILISLSEHTQEAIRDTMNSLGFEYQSDFARRYVAQGRSEGRAEGKTEGRLEIVLKLLTLRFGPLSEPVQTRIRSAGDAQLDAVAERLLTVQTLEEALSPLS